MVLGGTALWKLQLSPWARGWEVYVSDLEAEVASRLDRQSKPCLPNSFLLCSKAGILISKPLIAASSSLVSELG